MSDHSECQRHRNTFAYQNVVYIFVGCIILENHVLRIVAGSIVGIVGLAYVALEFIPSIEPPHTMREAEASWGAEQV